jgi:hypothetical protein
VAFVTAGFRKRQHVIVASKAPTPRGLFIGGLFAGFAVGGFVLVPIVVLMASVAFSHVSTSPAYVFVAVYVLAALLGGLAFWRIRLHLDFLSGFLGGAAAGLLGLGALCNVMLGGLGNMR